MAKIKRGDTVILLKGKDKGKQGVVTRIDREKSKIWVEGCNMVSKAVKPNPQANEEGGIKKQEAWIQISNVALFNPATGAKAKVAFKVLENGKKLRIDRKTNEAIGE